MPGERYHRSRKPPGLPQLWESRAGTLLGRLMTPLVEFLHTAGKCPQHMAPRPFGVMLADTVAQRFVKHGLELPALYRGDLAQRGQRFGRGL